MIWGVLRVYSGLCMQESLPDSQIEPVLAVCKADTLPTPLCYRSGPACRNVNSSLTFASVKEEGREPGIL